MQRLTYVSVVGLAVAVLGGAVGCQSGPSGDGWIELFNGQDLSGWVAKRPENLDSWSVHDGILQNKPTPEKHGTDIFTERTFDDFDLHVEFKVPPNSNSGVYLRGRYEVQINSHDGELNKGSMGAIYGLYAPSENASNPWNEWQRYDITLVGKTVSVKLNNKLIIDGAELHSVTGGALQAFLDPDKPGPIMLQGDHGEICFRSVRLKPRVAE
jgi:hypothetical protein